MIKHVQCLRRHPDLTPVDFRQHWDEYKPLWQALAERLGAVRVSFSTTLAVEANQLIVMQRGTDEPFDAIVETWAHDALDLGERMANPLAAGLRDEVVSKQHQFLDLGRCSFFFATDD
jgi:hypothetical protein